MCPFELEVSSVHNAHVYSGGLGGLGVAGRCLDVDGNGGGVGEDAVVEGVTEGDLAGEGEDGGVDEAAV